MSVAKTWLTKEKEIVPRLRSAIDSVLASEKSMETLEAIIAKVKK